MLKISVCCCTYNRPHLLGELIESFQRQTYPSTHCELVILDDAGQYGDMRGKNWQIVSFPRRFGSLGEKRNACVSLTSIDSTHIIVADDDDIYLPWWLECHVENFERGAKWSFAGSIFWSERNKIVKRWWHRDEVWIMHPAHAFEKKMFWECGGYPHMAWGEDRVFFDRLRDTGHDHADALRTNSGDYRMPYLIFRRNPCLRHVHATGMELDRYQKGFPPELPKTTLEVGWGKDYLLDAHKFIDKENNK